ncbi:MAG TPA: hypothetical protein VIO81_01285, partial [Methyloversatilis sp.]
ELIYLASAGRLRRVIGDTGTTLLTARWLVPEAEALSILPHLPELMDPAYMRASNRLGVKSLE